MEKYVGILVNYVSDGKNEGETLRAQRFWHPPSKYTWFELKYTMAKLIRVQVNMSINSISDDCQIPLQKSIENDPWWKIWLRRVGGYIIGWDKLKNVVFLTPPIQVYLIWTQVYYGKVDQGPGE